ncbi:unnamed protein product [Phytophthora lilii]|uniref:Unnamed protein product n=1 Tax=Phytophthora lilii TaxID=2077276 RepID=A0A9W6TAW4_9STRA|nr:unnamed protein product [Phytophthora lilii]
MSSVLQVEPFCGSSPCGDNKDNEGHEYEVDLAHEPLWGTRLEIVYWLSGTTAKTFVKTSFANSVTDRPVDHGIGFSGISKQL